MAARVGAQQLHQRQTRSRVGLGRLDQRCQLVRIGEANIDGIGQGSRDAPRCGADCHGGTGQFGQTGQRTLGAPAHWARGGAAKIDDEEGLSRQRRKALLGVGGLQRVDGPLDVQELGLSGTAYDESSSRTTRLSSLPVSL